MAKNVIIMGASGHAKVIADIVLCSGDNLVGFLDDDDSKQDKVFYGDRKIIGKIRDSEKYAENLFIIAVGDNHIRERIVGENKNLAWYSAIHPKAVIANTVEIGEGTAVMAGAIINSDTVIGRHCIVNTACSIDHDNNLGDYVHISPGVHLAGTVSVGDYSWVCAGAIIANNIRITEDVILGANATALKDIDDTGVYIGTPARRIK